MNVIANSAKKVRTGACVNAYLVLRQNNTVLLHLRKNTGYCDGLFCLVAGGVEDGESAAAAIVREAYEEAGILIEQNSLKAVHVIHRNTSRFHVDLFFECWEWKGNLTNCEPEKCGGLDFYPLDQLPANMIDYVNTALEEIVKENFYSEYGWQPNV